MGLLGEGAGCAGTGRPDTGCKRGDVALDVPGLQVPRVGDDQLADGRRLVDVARLDAGGCQDGVALRPGAAVPGPAQFD